MHCSVFVIRKSVFQKENNASVTRGISWYSMSDQTILDALHIDAVQVAS